MHAISHNKVGLDPSLANLSLVESDHVQPRPAAPPQAPATGTPPEPRSDSPLGKMRKSLALRVILSVCLTASLTLLIIGIWQSEMNRREALDRIQSKLKIQAQAVSESVSDSFWRMDRVGSRKTLARFRERDKYAIYLLTPQKEFWDGIIQQAAKADPGKPIGSESIMFRALSKEDWAKQKSILQDPQAISHIVIRQNAKAEEGIIGTVVLVPNQPQLRAAQWQAVQREMMFVALLDLVLIIAISWSLHGSFLKPIQHFARAARNLGKGDYKVRLGSEAHRPDEIGEMARAFNFMAEENEAHTRELEQRVLARTEELARANSELKDKMDILRRSQEEVIENRKMGSLGRMAAGFAHEVNTPLSASLTAAYLVEESLEEIRDLARQNPDISAEILERVEEAMETSENTLRPMLERAGEHVQSLKRIASLQLQQGSARETVFDVHQTLRDVVRNLSPDAHRAGIVISEPPATTMPLQASGNPASLSQAMENLIRNAMQHAFTTVMDRNNQIQCIVWREGKEIIVKISDNGRGISEEDQPHIFDPYVTGARGRADRGSVGLGLYFVRQVTQGFHGRVWCESVLAKGSSFYLALPAV